jgi:hypothetical protein
MNSTPGIEVVVKHFSLNIETFFYRMRILLRILFSLNLKRHL